MPNDPTSRKLAFTVHWQVREGQSDAAAAIITRFTPLARQEPGLEHLAVHRNAAKPDEFLFYEVFSDADAFEAHQQTPHFRDLILQQAIPLLAQRERVQYDLL